MYFTLSNSQQSMNLNVKKCIAFKNNCSLQIRLYLLYFEELKKIENLDYNLDEITFYISSQLVYYTSNLDRYTGFSWLQYTLSFAINCILSVTRFRKRSKSKTSRLNK